MEWNADRRTFDELLSYQWDPHNPAFADPHIHLSPHLGIADRNIKKYHLPTGMVLIEGFLLMLVREFEVVPLRQDWEQVLGSVR